MKVLRLVAPLSLAVVAAGCASGAPAKSASYGAAPTANASARVATRGTELGTTLVDARGLTLYLFEKDHGATSRCYGSCAGVWPPLTTRSKPAAGAGASASQLGFSRRTDGKRIVTYSGHPLYTYAGDDKPGQVNGQGADQFGGEWYALSPSGRKIDADD
jgi:predicted lipoprotein with Yx(FWY)xxD motif